MNYDWNPAKNEKLIAERGVSFEEVVHAIENGRLLDKIEHPNTAKYGHQKMFVVELRNYIYLVPFVENKEGVFFKTIIPSRKAGKRYPGRDHDEKN